MVVTSTLGIDLGGSLIKAVVCDGDGTVLARACEPSLVSEGPGPTLERVAAIAGRLSDGYEVSSAGLGICGPVDHQAGIVLDSPILPGWGEVAVVEPLTERLGLPLTIENDGACAMLGEWWRGAAERESVVAGLTIGTGVGGGLVIDGTIYRGGGSWGAEFGHVAVAPGPACACGGRGCVTQVASITATLERYERSAGEPVKNFSELLRRGSAGDDHAERALTVSLDGLADAVRVLVNTLNPSIFLVAGGMAQWGDTLAQEIEARLKGTTFAGLDLTPVRTARLGLYSGAVGAARPVKS